jgi:2-hydroxychromene-2-carboxylate isomerase
MVYKPVLFAAMLKHHGQLGPAEIAGKREWTYRQVVWQAQQMGVPLDMPLAHPFNPLALLRLAVACSANGEPNRFVCDTLFKHVWQGGAAADEPQRSVDAPEVKDQLKANTEEAIACGVFGVPTFVVDDKVFWGLDALPMLRAYLDGDAWFDLAWDAAARTQTGIKR